jgi:hypothetical protein
MTKKIYSEKDHLLTEVGLMPKTIYRATVSPVVPCDEDDLHTQRLGGPYRSGSSRRGRSSIQVMKDLTHTEVVLKPASDAFGGDYRSVARAIESAATKSYSFRGKSISAGERSPRTATKVPLTEVDRSQRGRCSQ